MDQEMIMQEKATVWNFLKGQLSKMKIGEKYGFDFGVNLDGSINNDSKDRVKFIIEKV